VAPQWRASVGPAKVVLGVLAETLLSVLLAPVLMVEQTTAVYRVFRGKDGGWNPQEREANGYSVRDTFRHHAPAIILGVLLTVSAFAISPVFAAWLAPATIGMILAASLSHWTGKPRSGELARKLNLLECPEEVSPPASFLQSIAERPSYRALTPPSFSHLLKDRTLRARRLNIVDPYWPLKGSDVHTPLALARARADRLSSIEEYEIALRPPEKLALLNSPRDLDAVLEQFTARDLHYSTGTT
jgi:membrane glycosyltransferase